MMMLTDASLLDMEVRDKKLHVLVMWSYNLSYNTKLDADTESEALCKFREFTEELTHSSCYIISSVWNCDKLMM